MRILYVSKALVVGTYQRKMEEMARMSSVDLHVAVPPSWRDERGEQQLELTHLDGYQLWRLPLLFNGSFHFHLYPGLGRLLDRVRPDILHMDEEPYNLATAHAAWLAARRRLPFVFFTWQNLMRHYPPPFAWFETFVGARTAYAIAGNRDAVAVLRAKGYRGPVTVIPQFGIDPELFRPVDACEDRPFTIGYAGRFVKEKGLTVLFDALAELPETDAWRFVARGSGPLRDVLLTRARALGIADRVVLSPALPSTEMPAFYHSLDVLVLPSLTRPNWMEQFGRVLIEAMACGVPVIGSDSGEIPHVVGDAGVIVPEGDIAALCTVLVRLMRRPADRAALASAGRRRAVAHFTQAQVAHRTWTVYDRILRKQLPSQNRGLPV